MKQTARDLCFSLVYWKEKQYNTYNKSYLRSEEIIMATLFVICVIGYFVYLWIQDSVHTSRRNEIARQNWNTIADNINKQNGREVIKKK